MKDVWLKMTKIGTVRCLAWSSGQNGLVGGRIGHSREKSQACWLKFTGQSGAPGGKRLCPAPTVGAHSTVATWRPRLLGQWSGGPTRQSVVPNDRRPQRLTQWSARPVIEGGR
jgi:hypothetical protein